MAPVLAESYTTNTRVRDFVICLRLYFLINRNDLDRFVVGDVHALTILGLFFVCVAFANPAKTPNDFSFPNWKQILFPISKRNPQEILILCNFQCTDAMVGQRTGMPTFFGFEGVIFCHFLDFIVRLRKLPMPNIAKVLVHEYHKCPVCRDFHVFYVGWHL